MVADAIKVQKTKIKLQLTLNKLDRFEVRCFFLFIHNTMKGKKNKTHKRNAFCMDLRRFQ